MNTEFIKTKADAIRANVALIATKMRQHSVEKIEVEYNGCGDSGEETVESIECFGGEPFNEMKVAFIERKTSWLDQELVITFAEGERTVDDALTELLSMVLEDSQHDGYENGDGGGGTMTVKADGKMVTEHYENYISTNDYTMRYEAPAAQVDALVKKASGENPYPSLPEPHPAAAVGF